MKWLVRLLIFAIVIAAVVASIGYATTKGNGINGDENFTSRWGKVLVVQSSSTTETELQDITGYLRSLKIPYDVIETSQDSFSSETFNSETFYKDTNVLKYSILVFCKSDRTTFEEITGSAWDAIYTAKRKGMRIVFSGLALTLDDPEFYSRVFVEKVVAWDIPKGFTFYETLFKVGNLMDIPVYQPIRVADILVEAEDPSGYVAWAYGNTYVSADNGIGIIKYYVLDKAIKDARIPVTPNMFALDNDDISGMAKFANPPFNIEDSKKILKILDRYDAYITNAVESENLDMKLADHLLSRKDRYINTLHETIVFAPEEETEKTYTKLMDKMISYQLVENYSNQGIYIPPVHQIKTKDLQILNKYGVKYVAQDMEMDSIQGAIAKPIYGDLWLVGRVFINGLHFDDSTKLHALQEVQNNTGNFKLDWDQALYIWLEQLNKTIWRKVPFYTHETNFAGEAPGLEILQNYMEYLEIRISEKTTLFNVGEYHRQRRDYTVSSLIDGDNVKMFINVKKPIKNLSLYHSDFNQVILDGKPITWQKHKGQKNIIFLKELAEGEHVLVLKNQNKAQLGTYFMSIPADNASSTSFWIKTSADKIKVSASKGEVSTLERGEDGVYKGVLYAGGASGWSSIVVKNKDGELLGTGRVYLAPPEIGLEVAVPDTVLSDKVTITGTVREDAEISINGLKVVNNLGTFQGEMALQPGTNFFTIVAMDKEGRTKTIIKKVTRN